MKHILTIISYVILASIVFYLLKNITVINLEMLLILIISHLFLSEIENNKVRIFFSFIFAFGFSIQLASIYNTGDYLSVLTVMNLGEAEAIGKEETIKTISIIIISMTSFYIQLSFPSIIKIKNKKILTLVLIIPIISFGPYKNLSNTFHSATKEVFYSFNSELEHDAYNKFLKHKIYEETKIPNELKNLNIRNVVVIFTEGLSAQVIDSINNKKLDITTNLDRAYKNGFHFYNYYNHTSATYRGLRGQLTSGYQFFGGYTESKKGVEEISDDSIEKEYRHKVTSLPQILSKNGYDTSFITSTTNNSKLYKFIKTLGFKNVYGSNDFKNTLDSNQRSDKDTFKKLKEVMKKNVNNFFIGIYPSGTHYGLDSIDLKYGDGKNKYYNKFYNYDHYLGDFIDWFKSSDYFKNTLLIITSDHSTIPTPEYNESFNSNTKFLVDKIPLIFLGAGVQTGSFDAKGKNSLGLSPTILNLLGIKNHKNLFLGCSFFEKNCASYITNISAIGNEFYKTTSDTVNGYSVTKIPKVKKIVEFYKLSSG